MDADWQATQVTSCQPGSDKFVRRSRFEDCRRQQQQQIDRRRNQRQNHREAAGRVRKVGAQGDTLSGSGQRLEDEDGKNRQKFELAFWRRPGFNLNSILNMVVS